MSYLALRFDAPAAEADAWSDALLETGALSVDMSDPDAGTGSETPLFGEPGSPALTSWPVARIVALFNAGSDPHSTLVDLAGAFAAPVPVHEVYPVAEQEWVRQTQAQFGPIRIPPGMWIVPTWSEVDDPGATTLRLDPGLAFGTGSHPTTRLCLEWLQQNLRGGETVVDYGCGSGILAIAARKLGSGATFGIDVDPQAVEVSVANARLNRVECSFGLPADVAMPAADILIANILANPLIMLAPMLASRVAAAGSLALSGILEAQAKSVVDAYRTWFTLAPWRSRDGWVLLASRRSS